VVRCAVVAQQVELAQKKQAQQECGRQRRGRAGCKGDMGSAAIAARERVALREMLQVFPSGIKTAFTPLISRWRAAPCVRRIGG